ncbi:CPBP family glutamic-type intramembrane protease [Arthrobacter burdickii]|uniref:CPBP family glutamic-type intramembrane protease n=1 Tax=Arthrobacter burdickii TaxID=3035920 RepID=A0ABT8JWH8_9MICC|nr:CPBP family glutamic-type intramembrane protease [Arthrobacter burdickii]MDN4609535.1 CPBP family glutamic-type intramembrane protease [Arthrobacter burdickii]
MAVAAGRARAVIARRPILCAVLITLAWYAVLFTLAETVASLHPDWFPDLGATLVNLGAAAVPIGLILWLGWSRSAGLVWRRPDRSWWLVTPLVLEAVSYSLDGVVGTWRELLSAAVLYTVLASSEETLSRGLVQRVLAVLGPVRAAVGVGVLFGAGHTLSRAWFSHPFDVEDTVFITINAAAFGFACAALRWHLKTIWPLVAVHALGDFLQILSPGNLPFGVRVAYLLGFIAYGWWLLRRLPEDATDQTGVTSKTSPAA